MDDRLILYFRTICFWEGPDSKWYWISFFAKKKNVLKFLYRGSDVLKFLLKWGLAMFLRCSYFFPNLSLDVLIDLVLNQKNACISKTRKSQYTFKFLRRDGSTNWNSSKIRKWIRSFNSRFESAIIYQIYSPLPPLFLHCRPSPSNFPLWWKWGSHVTSCWKDDFVTNSTGFG